MASCGPSDLVGQQPAAAVPDRAVVRDVQARGALRPGLLLLLPRPAAHPPRGAALLGVPGGRATSRGD